MSRYQSISPAAETSALPDVSPAELSQRVVKLVGTVTLDGGTLVHDGVMRSSNDSTASRARSAGNCRITVGPGAWLRRGRPQLPGRRRQSHWATRARL